MTLEEKKKQIFDFLGITQLHNLGYKGRGIKILSLEGRARDEEDHGHLVVQTIKQVAPEAEIVYWDEAEEKNMSYFNDMEGLADFCIENKINIITSSVTITKTDERIKAVQKMHNAGIIFCNIVYHNKNKNITRESNCLSSIPEIVSVSEYRLDDNGKIVIPSTADYGEVTDLIGIGGVPIDQYGNDGKIDNNWYGESCGTPTQAGMFALIEEINPSINSLNIDKYLCDNTRLYNDNFKGLFRYLVLDCESIRYFKIHETVSNVKTIQEENKENLQYQEREVNNMINPYMKSYKISQHYSEQHTGIDLVGKDKYIYSVCGGTVSFCNWENVDNKKQGFGLYVRILGDDGLFYYYGHLNWISEKISIGTRVEKGTLLGLEGSTGKSTGSHLHLEIRKKIGVIKNINDSVNVEELLFNESKVYDKVKEKYNFADDTIEYLKKYKYADALFAKLL